MPAVNVRPEDLNNDESGLSQALDRLGNFSMFREVWGKLMNSEKNTTDVAESLIANGITDIPVPSSEAVRYGPFTLNATFTDNGAIPNASSLITNIYDPALLRSGTTNAVASDNTLADQVIVITGARLLVLGTDAENGADVFADVLMYGGLHIKTDSTSPSYERRIGLGGFSGTVYDVLAVANTNAATKNTVSGRGASGVPFRPIPPTPVYLRKDTLTLEFGKQINTAGNINCYVQVQGYAFDWTQVSYRPVMPCPPRGRWTNLFGHRRRGVEPRLNLL